MPGRPSVRASRASAASGVSRKSSTQTLRSRASASTRTSVYAVEIPEEGQSTSLRERVCSIFSDAQRGAVTQRKSAVNLRKIQELCCYETPNPRKHAFAEDAGKFDEADFNEEVGRCALRILAVKKSEPIGDRLVRFLGLFLKYASEKGWWNMPMFSFNDLTGYRQCHLPKRRRRY
jgi:condensin complex subunit 3